MIANCRNILVVFSQWWEYRGNTVCVKLPVP
jgi:hypothetical protein